MNAQELITELGGKFNLIGEPKLLQSPSNAGTAKLYSQDYLELSEDEKYGVFRTVNYYLYDRNDGKGEIAFYEGKSSERVFETLGSALTALGK